VIGIIYWMFPNIESSRKAGELVGEEGEESFGDNDFCVHSFWRALGDIDSTFCRE
jgi:hypothetical protein